MRKLMMVLGAASVLTLPGAAVAKEHGRGGNGHGNGGYEERRGDPDRPEYRTHNDDRYERADRDDRGGGYRHGCPPGLAKKHNGCQPPGQAWRTGQRAPWNSDRYVNYGSLPAYYRNRYPDSSGQQYYYAGNRVYVIDQATQLIRNIFNIRR